jgi:hypothetical protein
MFRVVAICLVALAAYDLTLCGGQYIHAFAEMARYLLN